jgi:hypothetical protein
MRGRTRRADKKDAKLKENIMRVLFEIPVKRETADCAVRERRRKANSGKESFKREGQL